MKNPYAHILNQYKTIDLRTRVDAADPHELISLLFQGAKKHLSSAQGNIARQQLSQKGEHLSRALGIIAGLKTCLNHEEGGEVADNLLKIYEYIEQLILNANLNNDKELLVQANKLLGEIYEAWQAISPNPMPA